MVFLSDLENNCQGEMIKNDHYSFANVIYYIPMILLNKYLLKIKAGRDLEQWV